MLLYVHVPFCRRKCTYCAFHSVIPKAGDMERYAGLLRKEAEHWGRALKRPTVTSVYLGGGTPSLLELPMLASVVSAIRRNFALKPDLEFTMEANPDSIMDMSYLYAMREMGINRLSIGVQSLHDNYLKTLGRPHTADQARGVVRLARDCGFTNISVDLIWGLPKQRLYTWMKELREVVLMRPDHLSCYGLTLEPGTPLEELSHKVDMEMAPDDDMAKMFLYGAEFLESEGYLQYEISNFARMGYTSRHNQGYWEGKNYLGLGPAAVSTIKHSRWENPHDLNDYAKAVDSGKLGRNREELDLRTRVREMVMLRLRTSKGLNLASYQKLAGVSFTKEFGPLVRALRQNELIRITGGYIRLSKAGMLVSDTILANLFSDEPSAPHPLPSP
ncbi:radical SAM family heme chaperone HemW [Desulfovibrio ferrophilus]|uniref:Heme chaperone HemW n=1 Tax=Desulfovibrio ferrophilus TaxID=241368 RepID=A0A2Z6B050_9BACT|nr:radical SAM family heme chaperone HemW [Desulfovibrio ferrophilus]BBD08830.1 putative oxygen-independent coproporphyrinogen III oxidase [Desulfovibrio ferrophilus]